MGVLHGLHREHRRQPDRWTCAAPSTTARMSRTNLSARRPGPRAAGSCWATPTRRPLTSGRPPA
ncbi:MAG: hypothetical protein WKG07_16200 [Hymenobacter sp.]